MPSLAYEFPSLAQHLPHNGSVIGRAQAIAARPDLLTAEMILIAAGGGQNNNLNNHAGAQK